MDEPANRFDILQAARRDKRVAVRIAQCIALRIRARPASLAHIKCHRIRTPRGCGVQVHIQRHQKLAGANYGCSAPGVKLGRPKVGAPFRQQNLFCKAFIFTGADHRKIAAALVWLCRLIKIDRDTQFAANFLGQFPGISRCLFHCNSRHRHKRTDIGGPHARMFALVLAHVDQPARKLDGVERGVHNCIRCAYKSYHRAVCGLARIYIQEPHTRDGFDAVRDLFNDRQVIAFRKIGDAFNKLFHV